MKVALSRTARRHVILKSVANNMWRLDIRNFVTRKNELLHTQVWTIFLLVTAGTDLLCPGLSLVHIEEPDAQDDSRQLLHIKTHWVSSIPREGIDAQFVDIFKPFSDNNYGDYGLDFSGLFQHQKHYFSI